ncbi:MAG: M48 family metalloprotease, partial [Sedimentisphaerales bacterium]
PGGYVFLTKGMLQNLTTEAQLAGILAHETAHVIARDSMAALSRKQVIDLLLIAVATQDTPAAAMRAAQLTRLFLDLSYSREDEQQADLAGLDYMVRAGYDPHGMIETMQMLQKQQEARPIEFFSTHPHPANRIAYLRQKIQAKYSNLAGLKTGTEDFNRGILKHLRANKAD